MTKDLSKRGEQYELQEPNICDVIVDASMLSSTPSRGWGIVTVKSLLVISMGGRCVMYCGCEFVGTSVSFKLQELVNVLVHLALGNRDYSATPYAQRRDKGEEREIRGIVNWAGTSQIS